MALMYVGASAQTFNGLDLIKIYKLEVTVGSITKKLVAEGFQKSFGSDGEVILWSPDCCLTIYTTTEGHFPQVICYTEAALREIMQPVIASGYKCTDQIKGSTYDLVKPEWMYTKPNKPSYHVYDGARGYLFIELEPQGARLERY